MRRASNENAAELEERLPDVRRWDLHGKMRNWIDQILQVEPPTTRGTWALHGSMQRPWSAKSRSKNRRKVKIWSCLDLLGALTKRVRGSSFAGPEADSGSQPGQDQGHTRNPTHNKLVGRALYGPAVGALKGVGLSFENSLARCGYGEPVYPTTESA